MGAGVASSRRRRLRRTLQLGARGRRRHESGASEEHSRSSHGKRSEACGEFGNVRATSFMHRNCRRSLRATRSETRSSSSLARIRQLVAARERRGVVAVAVDARGSGGAAPLAGPPAPRDAATPPPTRARPSSCSPEGSACARPSLLRLLPCRRSLRPCPWRDRVLSVSVPSLRVRG